MGATCSTVQVVSGGSCASLAARCGISPANFTSYNPSSTLCSTLTPGEHVCCSSGSLPDYTPTPYANGTCATYLVQPGDYCAYLAAEYSITVADIENYNNNTWGWLGCSDLQAGQNICLSSGTPPFPSPVANAICGPQVPQTTPTNNSAEWASLNPCPLNSCCGTWGQCGTTPEFCTVSKSATGAPGTSAPGTSGCISNCGLDIANNDDPPEEFFNIGYFEAWNGQRSCLTMSPSQISPSYTHVHFAFANITNDFQIDLSQVQSTFTEFVSQTGFKRILSFGGWSFSTSQDSYPIFRQGVTAANRQTFANSIVSVVNQYNLDGVDFDWEYPGATDLPNVPPGDPEDGANYLAFLTTLRSVMPANKTISLAAPAFYWYLRGFPIQEMSEVLDYIVYMTYDLHGQWDWNNMFSNPGCPTGNCLRSHVNITETMYALSMITKAGVPANKVIVGVSSYGRSFGMVNPSCTGPECLFTGPLSGALPGQCTNTAGYIADAEIYQYLDAGAKTWHDDSSDSDMAVYGDSTWVAFMNQTTKNSRINLYGSYNFGGSVEWAMDLEEFNDNNSTISVKLAEKYFTSALSTSGYNMSSFNGNVTDLATKLVRWDGCDDTQKTAIYSGWQQSWKIMNLMYHNAFYDFNFNEAAAVEYLGAPALNKDQQDAIKDLRGGTSNPDSHFVGIYVNLATIQPGYISTPLDWKIHVRCDDPKGKCPCGIASDKVAYTTNKDAQSGIARINFCPLYFSAPDLDAAMKNGNDKSLGHGYGSMHIDWVSQAGSSGSNKHVSDIKMSVETVRGIKITPAYDPELVKSIARWGQDTDSLTLYAMARYVQDALGDVYPHLPLAPIPPDMVYPPGVFTASDDLFTIYANGSATVSNDLTALEWDAQGVCADFDDEDDDDNPDTVLDLIGGGFADSYTFPTSYLDDYVSWSNSTLVIPTATTALPAATSTPVQNWCQVLAFALVDELSESFSSGVEVYNAAGALVYEDNVNLNTTTIIPISASTWKGPYDFALGCTWDYTNEEFILCQYNYDGIIYQGEITTTPGVNEGSTCSIYLSC
ncbi:glycoside hydrolase family 18 protein [Xylogone sp. PMI_703]|nr:glycoside hydrolase family 18 protein [Xylogone sp. PMI_703]